MFGYRPRIIRRFPKKESKKQNHNHNHNYYNNNNNKNVLILKLIIIMFCCCISTILIIVQQYDDVLTTYYNHNYNDYYYNNNSDTNNSSNNNYNPYDNNNNNINHNNNSYVRIFHSKILSNFFFPSSVSTSVFHNDNHDDSAKEKQKEQQKQKQQNKSSSFFRRGDGNSGGGDVVVVHNTPDDDRDRDHDDDDDDDDDDDELLSLLNEYECVRWVQTTNCDPYDGAIESENTKSCDYVFRGDDAKGISGYCEIKIKSTNEIIKTQYKTCNFKMYDTFGCQNATKFYTFSRRAKLFLQSQRAHKFQNQLLFDSNSSSSSNSNSNTNSNSISPSNSRSPSNRNEEMLSEDQSSTDIIGGSGGNKIPSRGIVMSVTDEVLAFVYGIIKILRYHGCVLPIELWSLPGEITDKSDNIIHKLRKENVAFRTIPSSSSNNNDNNNNNNNNDIRGFVAKIYSILYSKFDQVLQIDSDNIPVRDPTYLFDCEGFVKTGTMFFQDYWQPSDTIFGGFDSKAMIWELLNLTKKNDDDDENEFESESGQLLIDRKRSSNLKPLTMLLFFIMHWHDHIEPMKLLHGDKDSYRLSFRFTNTNYYVVPKLPSSGGRYVTNGIKTKESHFCGNTMIQHDPDDVPLFFHKNLAKFHKGGDEIRLTHVLTYVGNDVKNTHRIRYTRGIKGSMYCFSGDENLPHFQITPLNDTYQKILVKTNQFANEVVSKES